MVLNTPEAPDWFRGVLAVSKLSASETSTPARSNNTASLPLFAVDLSSVDDLIMADSELTPKFAPFFGMVSIPRSVINRPKS